MKKYLLAIFTLLVICNIIIASNWDLLKPGKRWNNILISYPTGNYDTLTLFVKFEGDTIINTLKYRYAWESTDKEFDHKTLEGFVREDTLVGFYFRNLDGDEGLIYKYNLKLGESFKITHPFVRYSTINDSVIGVDSVLVDGKFKKRYTLQQSIHSFLHETWIEGIGSSFGILQSGLGNITTGAIYYFLCCYDNTVLIYKNPDCSVCYYPIIKTAVDPIQYSESGIKVYIGTNSDIINIKCIYDNSIRIYNSCGIYVETINVQSNKVYDLNVSRYSKGIYFISPTTNLSGSKKFIKY